MADTDTLASQTPEFVDQQLWQALADSLDSEGFFSAWLNLQCQQIAGVRSGVLLAETEAEKTFSPSAFWPAQKGVSALIVDVARTSLEESEALVIDLAREYANQPGALPDALAVSFPVSVQDHVVCVVALEIGDKRNADISQIMRQLQWGVSWLEAFYLRLQAVDDDTTINRLVTSLYVIANASKEPTCKEALTNFVTELASALDCERVSCGFIQGNHARVDAVSNSGQFARKMNLVNLVERSMDEAVQQNRVIHYPEREGNGVITQCHAALAGEQNGGVVLSIPLVAKGRNIGAICIESADEEKFDDDVVEMCQSIATLAGPILHDKFENDRWLGQKIVRSIKEQFSRLFGNGYSGRKIALASLALVALVLTFATGDFKISADSVLEGKQQRAIVAPFDGFVAESIRRVGDEVSSGEVLARLDDSDLRLDLVELTSSRAQSESQYDAALAQYDRAEAKTFRAKMDQADARISLVAEKLKRTELTAPLDGIIVSGDLSQSLGAAVTRGEALFQIASLYEYRVALKVDERDISYIQTGQSVQLLLSSLPNQTFDVTVSAMTPLTTSGDGRNYFRVEAELQDPAGILRPGMEGLAKIEVGERRYVWIWFREFLDWLRLFTWRWTG